MLHKKNSVLHSVEEAVEAQNLGASYITAGHIYATDCKKGLAPRGLEFLKEVCDSVTIPVYAIGGIDVDGTRRDEVKMCGAAGSCIMSGMMSCRNCFVPVIKIYFMVYIILGSSL